MSEITFNGRQIESDYLKDQVFPVDNPKQAQVVEIIHLTLADGVTYEQFERVHKTVAASHVAKQPGFISRESMRGENGEWVVFVHWASLIEAEHSMKSFATAPAAQEFMSLIKEDSMQMKRYFLENKMSLLEKGETHDEHTHYHPIP